MNDLWWQLSGPARFVDNIAQELQSGKNVVLALPPTVPDGLREAVAQRTRKNELWKWTEMSPEVGDGDVAELLGRLHDRYARLPAGSRLTPTTLATARSFWGSIVWVERPKADQWKVWKQFLLDYEPSCRDQRLSDRGLFCIAVAGTLADLERPFPVALGMQSWRGMVRRLDMVNYVAGLRRDRDKNALHRKVAIAIAVELAGSDGVLAGELARFDLPVLLQPGAFLAEFAVRRAWSGSSDGPAGWEAGTVDDFDDAEVVHSAYLAARGDDGEVRHRIWKAQVGVLFPFVEEQRRHLLPRLKQYLHHLKFPLQTENGEVKDYNDLELGQLAYFLRKQMQRPPIQTRQLLDQLKNMRDELAHNRPIPFENLNSPEVHAAAGSCRC